MRAASSADEKCASAHAADLPVLEHLEQLDL
jgi:hypothetical protein